MEDILKLKELKNNLEEKRNKSLEKLKKLKADAKGIDKKIKVEEREWDYLESKVNSLELQILKLENKIIQ